jgi:hypothetical protein
MIEFKKLRKASTPLIVGVAVIIFAMGAAVISLSKKTDVSKGLSATMIHFTGWRISHLLLHMVLGIVYPDKFPLFFSLGVTWEVVEYTIGALSSDDWWGEDIWAHVQDIIANTIGFLLGILLSKSIAPKSQEAK